MVTSLVVELEELQRLFSSTPVPRDDYNHHFFMKPRQLLEEAHEEFSAFLDGHFENLRGGRNNKAAEALRSHLQWVFLGLADAAMRGKWLLVSLDDRAYTSDPLLKRYGFKYAPTKAIVDYLERNGFATVKRGRQYKNNPARTLFTQTQSLPVRLLASICRQLPTLSRHTLSSMSQKASGRK